MVEKNINANVLDESLTTMAAVDTLGVHLDGPACLDPLEGPPEVAPEGFEEPSIRRLTTFFWIGSNIRWM